MRYGIRLCRMIYLLRKHDIISVSSYAEGIYHRSKSDIISKIYHPFHKGTDIIEKSHLGRQIKVIFSWPARRDSRSARVRSQCEPSQFYVPRVSAKANRRVMDYGVRIPFLELQLKKESTKRYFPFSGPPEGIRTPALQNRNLLRYPAAPRTDNIPYYNI